VVLYGEFDRNRRKLVVGRICGLGVGLAVFIVLAAAAYSSAQIPTSVAPPPPKAEPTTDLLGRDTPFSAMMGLLKSSERGDYEAAARYLQPTAGRSENLTEVAQQFHALQGHFKGNVGLLRSDDPNGTVEPGLPPGELRVGVLVVGGTTVDVILVRVDDRSSGKIWLISKKTVANIPTLYAQMESEGPTVVDRLIPSALTARRLLGMSLAKWLGWLLSIPISWLLAWLLAFLFSVPERIRCKLRKLPFRSVWKARVGRPLEWVIAILIHGLFVSLLAPPLLYRVHYFRFLAALLMGCFLWLVSVIADRGFEHVVNRMRAQRKGGEAILILMQRLNRILLLIIGLVAALAIFGINVKTTLAGLGIGGLAIALGAQKSLENLIAGVSLLLDQDVGVGDFCQIDTQLGTVEDIGLRSLKLRTLDQNLSIVPNGLLAQMQFQNMARRSKLLINQTFLLRIETQAEQLRFVLDRVQNMLDQHPAIERETCRVRVMSFAGAAFQLELFAYGKTGDYAQFTKIRQDVILKIAEIVEASGTGFAAPTQLAYLSRDKGVDAKRTSDIVRRITEPRAGDVFRFPGEARTRAD